MPKKPSLSKRPQKEEYVNQSRWQSLFRGSLLSTTINKHVSYVGLADRRAQAILTINSVLIPLAISGGQNPLFRTGAIIAVLTAILSITAALYSIYPKAYSRMSSKNPLLLHFSQIQKLSEFQYLEYMKKALEDTGRLAEMATQDIYYLSTHVLAPKFFWLKISYTIFFIGYLLSIGSIGWSVL